MTGSTVQKKELSHGVEKTKRIAQAIAQEDKPFLSTREDAEDLDASSMNEFWYPPGVSSSDNFYCILISVC